MPATIIRLLGFTLAVCFTIGWAVLWWAAYLPNPFHEHQWQLRIDFNAVNEAIPEGLLLHGAIVLFLTLIVYELKVLARWAKAHRKMKDVDDHTP